ncbi:MAG: NAD(P)-dependent oxidoreductase [Halomonas sp.]|nr:NAD(P)-dependent oxidoreductase [Halomonas sp.]
MSKSISTVAFIGLGVMGYPMAGHLARAGLTVRVFNRTAAKAKEWADEHGGSHHPTPREAAKGADLVLICVGNDDDVRQVTSDDDGALHGMTEGSLLVDHTTASADLALELDAACRERGIGFIDAPVSGGQQGAENGALTVMCGGSEADFARAETTLEHFAKAVTLMGPAGSGQLTKMVNQICIAGLVQGLAEGLHFAEQAGLDQQRVCLEQARRLQARLPVTALVDQFYADVQVMGGGRWDTSSLLRRLRAVGHL